MLTRRHLVVSMLALSAAGCAAQRDPVFQLRRAVEIGPYGNAEGVLVRGIEERHDAPYLGTYDNKYMIRSWVFNNQSVRLHQIYINHYYYGREISWNSAIDENRNALKFTQTQWSVTGCSTYGCHFFEEFGASIDDVLLRQHSNSGYPVEFGSKRGLTKRIFLSPVQIRAQLEVYDRLWTERWGQAGSDAEKRQQDRQPARARK